MYYTTNREILYSRCKNVTYTQCSYTVLQGDRAQKVKHPFCGFSKTLSPVGQNSKSPCIHIQRTQRHKQFNCSNRITWSTDFLFGVNSLSLRINDEDDDIPHRIHPDDRYDAQWLSNANSAYGKRDTWGGCVQLVFTRWCRRHWLSASQPQWYGEPAM